VREHSLSRFVPPSGFCALSTACSASGFAGLLHPAATSRVVSVQGFLPIRSRPDSSPGECPLAVGVRLLTGVPAATDENLGFGALFRGPKRAPESLFKLL
jgi:hypothetical protein